MKNDFKNKNLKKMIILMFIVLISGFIYSYGISYAKYAADSVWNYYLKSKGFYFNSDYLDITEVKNVNNLWDGQKVSFNIRNNLNQTVVTNSDITYTISCEVIGEASAYAECKMNGTNSNEISGTLSGYQRCVNNTEDQTDVSTYIKTNCELGGYEWVSDIAQEDLYFDVISTDENQALNDVIIRVEAKSNSPYKKTISGLFSLHKIVIDEGKIVSKIKEYSNYNKLIITNTYEVEKCINISWDPEKFLINLDGIENYSTNINNYVKEINVLVGSKTSKSYDFYLKDLSSSYEVSEFSVQESNDCN